MEPLSDRQVFERFLSELDINRAQAAKILGYSSAATHHWLHGIRNIPKSTRDYMELLLALKTIQRILAPIDQIQKEGKAKRKRKAKN